MRNRVITDAYEPGSTFKIITAASALDAGLVTPSEGFYCSGSVVVEGGKIRCWGRPHGAETFAQALQNSCNPVFVEMGLRLGVDRFYNWRPSASAERRGWIFPARPRASSFPEAPASAWTSPASASASPWP